MPLPAEVVADAPAKLNLGLEILGRRPDGYHDLATIFLAVDLCDTVTLRAAEQLELCCAEPWLETEENLVWKALRLLQHESRRPSGACATLRKRIPDAAGLGGASSDAAATLLAARALWQLSVPDSKILALAAQLGSDVPFFVQGGCALGRGRGDILAPLPIPANIWFVVVVPPIRLPRKTATLYAALRPEDFSGGDRVAAQAERLRKGQELDPVLLGSAFSRPLMEIAPSLRNLPELMTAAGSPSVALTGAGSAFYSMVTEAGQAEQIALKLRARLGSDTAVFVLVPYQPRFPALGQYDEG